MAARLLAALVLAALVAACAPAAEARKPALRPWFDGLDFTRTREKLELMPIKRIRPLKAFLVEELGMKWEGSNDLYLLDLKDGTRAVFRTEDQPWGSTAEVSGYRFVRYLHLKLVPPTVRRTLARGPAPGLSGWAWKEEERAGSVQLFIDARVNPGALERLSEKDRSDIEVVSFVFGRYDNHPGNLLLDRAGAPVLIDFEGSMNLQQVRYGEVPFVMHGARFHSPDSVPRTQPFPFDHALVLVDPTLGELKAAFAPWWGQKWPAGMEMCHKMAQQVPGKRVPYVVWDDQLWVQMDMPRRHVAHTDVYSRRTLDRLKLMSKEALRMKLLTAQYSPEHIEGFIDRRTQLLEAARSGRIIP